MSPGIEHHARADGVLIGLRLAAAKLEERARKNPIEARILRAAAKEIEDALQ